LRDAVVRRLVFSQFRRERNGVALSKCIASLLCVVVSFVYYMGENVVVYESYALLFASHSFIYKPVGNRCASSSINC